MRWVDPWRERVWEGRATPRSVRLMIVLGYPRTWLTYCFLPNGCESRVWGHTNGTGDFVLFVLLDSLGFPWPVHSCYEHRRDSPLDSGDDPARATFLDELKRRRECQPRMPPADLPSLALDKSTVERYEKDLPARTPDIAQITAVDYVGKGEFPVIGYVQEVIEGAVGNQLRSLEQEGTAGGSLFESQLKRKLGARNTQITVVDSSFQSFTFYADTSELPLARHDSVCAMLLAQKPLFPQLTGRH
jgi:hypothetical protein